MCVVDNVVEDKSKHNKVESTAAKLKRCSNYLV
jgi:hypothetical protein